MGSQSDGADSKAYEVAPREHWPEMQALILVVSDEKKTTASTAGMQLTVETSPLLQHRLTQVPTYMANITRAIEQRDFAAFAEATMRDSNQFHAVCLDTFPPIFYLSDVSRAIVHVVSELNRAAGRPVAAYTFDAGPNAVLYALEGDMPEIISLMAHYFPPALEFDDPFKLAAKPAPSARDGFKHGVSAVWEQGKVARFIHTRIGDGPRVLGADESLLTAEGLPKTLKQ
jgi:diphosphomevalonate decarboxylase